MIKRECHNKKQKKTEIKSGTVAAGSRPIMFRYGICVWILEKVLINGLNFAVVFYVSNVFWVWR